MSKVINIQNENHLNQLIADNNNLVLDFFADWCGPCKMLLPVLDEVSTEKSDITICKVNVEEVTGLAQKYGVRSIPTVIYYRNGEIIDKTMGYLPKPEVLKQLDKVYTIS